ncbi:MAG: winged helix-turn-helix domain-containing protein [Eubacteriales bacterium]
MARNLEREVDMLRVEVDELRRTVVSSAQMSVRPRLLTEESGMSADEAVVRIFGAFASRERLLITIELLKNPSSAAQLVDACALNTTGQAYHHLNVLTAAGVIEEHREHGGKSVYTVKNDNIDAVKTVISAVKHIK